MATATVTSRGRITLPVDVRRSLRVHAGDRVEFVEVAPGRYEVVAATRPVTALKGMFGKRGKAVSIDAMNAVIARRRRGVRSTG
jgi:AbrB family looped-hinge helix DNA binding protein